MSNVALETLRSLVAAVDAVEMKLTSMSIGNGVDDDTETPYEYVHVMAEKVEGDEGEGVKDPANVGQPEYKRMWDGVNEYFSVENSKVPAGWPLTKTEVDSREQYANLIDALFADYVNISTRYHRKDIDTGSFCRICANIKHQAERFSGEVGNKSNHYRRLVWLQAQIQSGVKELGHE